MARNVYTSPDGRVDISAFAGPARANGGMRRRYQVTVISDQDGRHHWADLSYEEFQALKLAIGRAH